MRDVFVYFFLEIPVIYKTYFKQENIHKIPEEKLKGMNFITKIYNTFLDCFLRNECPYENVYFMYPYCKRDFIVLFS